MAINLEKGQRINLEKTNGATMTEFCVGCNWGGIEKIVKKEVTINEGFLGFGRRTEWQSVREVESVDLDLSCVLIDNYGKICDHIYSPLYKPEVLGQLGLPAGKLQTAGGALQHSGDDLEGDADGDDGLDNEIIKVNLNKVPSNVSQIFFFLNNVGREDFSQIPYAKIRMYEGTPEKVNSVFAQYDVAAERQYAGRKAIIMGKLYKNNGVWKFHAIGEPTEDIFVGQTVLRIENEYAK